MKRLAFVGECMMELMEIDSSGVGTMYRAFRAEMLTSAV